MKINLFKNQIIITIFYFLKFNELFNESCGEIKKMCINYKLIDGNVE